MSESRIESVPTNVITGFLGVGKTTAILDLLERSPEGERWAVLVNEFGEVGIDGAAMTGAGQGVAIQEVPGGCICCANGVMFRVGIVSLLKSARPDRLIIEPTGLADAGAILDTLREEQFSEALDVRATITLVDPRKFCHPRWAEHEVFAAQVEAADVLVANRCDVTSQEDLDAFDARAAALFPPKERVERTEHGRLDLAWLDETARDGGRHHHHHHDDHDHDHDHGHKHDHDGPLTGGEDAGDGVRRYVGEDLGVETYGLTFPADVVFSAREVARLLRELPSDRALLPGGFVRLKGVVRSDEGWAFVQADEDGIGSRATGWRGDSRVEMMAPSGSGADWPAIERAWRDAALE